MRQKKSNKMVRKVIQITIEAPKDNAFLRYPDLSEWFGWMSCGYPEAANEVRIIEKKVIE